MQTKAKRRALFAVGVFMGISVLILSIWNLQMQKDHRAFSQACAASCAFVYDHLAECGQAFTNYAATRDICYLNQAQNAAAKTTAACYAWGESYAYRADYDTADDAIQEWVIQFLIQTDAYLAGLKEHGISAQDEAVLDAMAEVFQGDASGRVTFMSVFWNAMQSDLDESPVWFYLTYENGDLERPDF